MSNFNKEYKKILNETKIWNAVKKAGSAVKKAGSAALNSKFGSAFISAAKPSGFDKTLKNLDYVRKNKAEVLGGAAGKALKNIVKFPKKFLDEFGRPVDEVKAEREKQNAANAANNMPQRQIIDVQLPIKTTPIRLRYNMWDTLANVERQSLHNVYSYLVQESKNPQNPPEEQRTFAFMEQLLRSLVDHLNLDQTRIGYELTNLPKINPQTTSLETFVDKYFSKMFN